MDNDILSELKNEAIDTVDDKIASMGIVLSDVMSGTETPRNALARMRLEAHSIKAVAASFEMVSLKGLAHRFEDYLSDIREVSKESVPSIQFFIDRLAEAMEAWLNDKPYDVSAVMRTLPAKGSFDENDISVTQIEVMLVMEPSLATKIVTRELVECGYRIVNVASTMDAIQLIPSMAPDAVIASREMPELSGVDLACALKAMPTTKHIPVALIAATTRVVAGLPDNVPVIHKGEKFADDIANVFVKLGIL